jgi:urease accessory protein UreF
LRGEDQRRGFGRAAAVLWAAALVAMFAYGCGKSGHGADTDPEKSADAATLNAALSRELTAARAYSAAVSLLPRRLRAVGREFHAQELEYVDAITKAIRGVGGEAEAETEELGLSDAKHGSGVLDLLYELENAALASYLDAAPRLNTAAPRALATSLAVGHAQHLVVLRQALGAGLAAAAPQAFDVGETPPPVATPPAGGR